MYLPRQIFEVKSEYFFHAASDILFCVKNKADGNSNIGFARLCFVQQFDKGHTNTLKLSAGLRTQSVECSRLGKTRIIKDAGRGMVRNTGFYGQICLGQISSGTFGSYFSWYHS